MYNLIQVFEIVYPKDPTLKHVTLKLKNGFLVVKSLLKFFRIISIKGVAKSSAWYSAFGSLKDSSGTIQNFGRDFS